MLVDSPVELVHGDCFLAIKSIAPHLTLNVKLEGLSVTGSIKLKPAAYMLSQLELSGTLQRGSRIVESSSGNLGLALSMICAAKGYHFTCISDPNTSPQTARMIRAYGADLVIVQQKDRNGGYLGTRIELIKSMLDKDPSLVWINQYENLNNVQAHYHQTGPEILHRFPKPDFVFVGSGTTGTLGGVSRYLGEHSPSTTIVAVDSEGSVTFGGRPGKRHIPGLGTSEPPAIREHSMFDELLMVGEAEAIRMCHRLAKEGVFLGGSSGTVLAGVQAYAHRIAAGACVIAISPDMGDRYIDTVYDMDWVGKHFPELLSMPASATTPAPALA